MLDSEPTSDLKLLLLCGNTVETAIKCMLLLCCSNISISIAQHLDGLFFVICLISSRAKIIKKKKTLRDTILLLCCKVHSKCAGEKFSLWTLRKRFNQINNQDQLLWATWNRLHICKVERYKRFSITLFYTHEMFHYSDWLNRTCPYFTPQRCFSIYWWLNVNFICLAGVTKCFKCLFTLMSKYMLDLVTSYWFNKTRCGRQLPLRESETSRSINISINVPHRKSLSDNFQTAVFNYEGLFQIPQAEQMRHMTAKLRIGAHWSSKNQPVWSTFSPTKPNPTQLTFSSVVSLLHCLNHIWSLYSSVPTECLSTWEVTQSVRRENPALFLLQKVNQRYHIDCTPPAQQNLRTTLKWWDMIHGSQMGCWSNPKNTASARRLQPNSKEEREAKVQSLSEVQFSDLLFGGKLQVWGQTQVKTAVGPIKQQIHQRRRDKNPQTNTASASGDTSEHPRNL